MLFCIWSDFGVTGADVRVGSCKYLLNQQTLSMLIEELFNMGYELIFLDTNLKNTRAQYVYELLGFKKIAINENSWKNQLGELLQTSIDYELRPSDFCNAKLIGWGKKNFNIIFYSIFHPPALAGIQIRVRLRTSKAT